MAILNTVMNLGFHKIFKNSSVSQQVAASQELSSIELVSQIIHKGTYMYWIIRIVNLNFLEACGRRRYNLKCFI
jgi:hypothetical protein